MLSLTIDPRFSDTDALGHISNTTLPVWFEKGRAPIWDIFHPSRDLKTWPLIIARIEIDYIAQTYWGKDVEIHSYIGKLGNASCPVIQEAYQEGKLVAKGRAVMVHFDFESGQSKTIPDAIRQELEQHRHPSLS